MGYKLDDKRLDATTLGSLVDALAANSGATNADAFGRARMSLPYQEVDVKFTDDLRPDVMTTVTTGTGAVTHSAGNSYAGVSITAASDKAEIRTRVPQRYRAGQSLLVIPTSVLAAAEAGLVQRVGYFNQSDGLFLQLSGTSASFVIRSSIDSTETEIAQASWSQDSFLGSGASGETLDFTKSVLLVIDLQYLGIGQIRFGFEFGGVVNWAHWQDYSNQGTTAYMASANLNLCWELEASETYEGSGATLRAICGTVIREGGNEEPISTQVASTAIGTDATPADATWESVVSVRVKAAHKFTASVLPDAVTVRAETNDCSWVVIRQSNDEAPAAVTGGAWTSVGDESVCEYSLVEAAVTITDGKKYAQGYATAGSGPFGSPSVAAANLFDTAGLGLDDGDDQDVLILACAGDGGASSVQAALQIQETR